MNDLTPAPTRVHTEATIMLRFRSLTRRWGTARLLRRGLRAIARRHLSPFEMMSLNALKSLSTMGRRIWAM